MSENGARQHSDQPEAEVLDVLIVGAGVSGIGMACHLVRECPGASFRILERRRAIGGTWDLFRFPGVRSDSDMYTFGYDFRPWNDVHVFADGPSIRRYVTDTAREYAVDRKIDFGVRLQRADYDSATARWTVTAIDESSGEQRTLRCRFLVGATGYYDYDHGYRPLFPGEEQFAGQIVHPQFWPDDLDWRGKNVVVIGSGATAVTVVPAMAEQAAHVTMLQRSPTYIVALPGIDKISRLLGRVLPQRLVYRQARWRNIRIQKAMYALSRRRPDLARKLVLAGVRRALGADADLSGFTPTYDPWDQRLCVVPDGDLFDVVRSGRAEVVTDRIDTFTTEGIRLVSGRHLPAELVVAATGLQIQLLGGAELAVDGDPVVINDRLTYKGVLIEGVPNAAMIFGYINASWTLKADLAASYICRLVAHMREYGFTEAVAHARPEDRGDQTVFGPLDSGYVRRGADVLPRQGTGGPWRVAHDYLHDAALLRKAPLEDGVLTLRRNVRNERPVPSASA